VRPIRFAAQAAATWSLFGDGISPVWTEAWMIARLRDGNVVPARPLQRTRLLFAVTCKPRKLQTNTAALLWSSQL